MPSKGFVHLIRRPTLRSGGWAPVPRIYTTPAVKLRARRIVPVSSIQIETCEPGWCAACGGKADCPRDHLSVGWLDARDMSEGPELGTSLSQGQHSSFASLRSACFASRHEKGRKSPAVPMIDRPTAMVVLAALAAAMRALWWLVNDPVAALFRASWLRRAVTPFRSTSSCLVPCADGQWRASEG